MKNLVLLLFFGAAGLGAFAQTSVLKTDFKHINKLGSKVKVTDVYTAAQKWFTSNPNLFTTKNAEPPATSKTKNKQEVEDAYNNKRPLQSLDPAANRLLGQGLIKYFGGTTTSIRLLFVKYDITIEVKVGQAQFSISNIRYFHFDPKSYTEAGVYSFAGGNPCEYTGTITYLMSCQISANEKKLFSDFFNKTVADVSRTFSNELKTRKMLLTPAPKQSANKVSKAKPSPAAVGR